VSLLPTIYGYGGYYVGGVSVVMSLIFLYQAYNLLRTLEIAQRAQINVWLFLLLADSAINVFV
jgi:protoheme IX farnesyltransferase